MQLHQIRHPGSIRQLTEKSKASARDLSVADITVLPFRGENSLLLGTLKC